MYSNAKTLSDIVVRQGATCTTWCRGYITVSPSVRRPVSSSVSVVVCYHYFTNDYLKTFDMIRKKIAK